MLCELPTSVCVFGFGVACESVAGGCGTFLFIVCLVPMEWAKHSILVLIPCMRSSVVCKLSLIYDFCWLIVVNF